MSLQLDRELDHILGLQFGRRNVVQDVAGELSASGLCVVSGVAVNSMMHEGLNRARVSKDSCVRALCASSMMTTGRQSRSTLHNDRGTTPSAFFSSLDSISAESPVK